MNGRRAVTWLAVVAFLVAAGALAWRYVPAIGPANAAQAYCDALRAQRYDAIYQMFTPATQSLVDAPTFSAAERLADTQAGAVASCDAARFAVSWQGATALVPVTVRRVGAATASTLVLRIAGDTDRLAALPDAAVPPFAVATRFCAALMGGDAAGAYALLAPTVRATLTPERFATFTSLADQNGGPLTTCAVSRMILSDTGTTASVTFSFQRQNSAPAATRPLPMTADATGAWFLAAVPTL